MRARSLFAALPLFLVLATLHVHASLPAHIPASQTTLMQPPYTSPSSPSVAAYTLYVRRVPASPDGFPRTVYGVFNASGSFGDSDEVVASRNRPFPGPLIRARLGDELRVTVVNELVDSVIGMHFHGLHSRNNPWMDGVPGVTECGIEPGARFTYVFDVNQTGTFWYHSHASVQYSDGLLGPIVLEHAHADDDPVHAAFAYARDYPIVLQDWFHESADDLLTNYVGPWGAFDGYTPRYPWPPVSVLLNGRGQFNCQFDNCSTTPPLPTPCDDAPECIPLRAPYIGACVVPPSHADVFECPAGGATVRLRLINGANTTPMRFWIDRHALTVVARDGVPVRPRVVRFVTLGVAERFDVIVNCSLGGTGLNYRMFVSMAHGYIPTGSAAPLLWYSAVLGYHANASDAGDAALAAPELPMPESLAQPALFNDTQLFAYAFEPLAPRTAPPARRRIVIESGAGWDSEPGSPLEVWVVNNRTFVMPMASLLQALVLDSPPLDDVLPRPRPGRNNNTFETYVERLEYGAVYEVVVIAMGGQQHPWHLHGYTVDFVGAGLLRDLDRTTFVQSTRNVSVAGGAAWTLCNSSSLNTANLGADVSAALPALDAPAPVLSVGDSWTVPGYGYVAFRFRADNAGPWMLHCHVEWHMALGMGLLLSVERADLLATSTWARTTIAPNVTNPYGTLIADAPADMRVCGAGAASFANAARGLAALVPAPPIAPWPDSAALSLAEWIGVVVGAFVLGAALAVLVVLLLVRRRLRVVALDKQKMLAAATQVSSSAGL
jgi:L-ascorbate oxidase